MPTVSRIFIKSGLLFLVASLVAGLMATAPQALGLPGWMVGLRTTYFHLFTVGWITQIIFGVALWLFPRWSRDKPRGPIWLSWACFATLNLGLVTRAVAEAGIAAGYGGTAWSVAMTTAAVLLFSSALLFSIAVWPRIQKKKKRRG